MISIETEKNEGTLPDKYVLGVKIDGLDYEQMKWDFLKKKGIEGDDVRVY